MACSLVNTVHTTLGHQLTILFAHCPQYIPIPLGHFFGRSEPLSSCICSKHRQPHIALSATLKQTPIMMTVQRLTALCLTLTAVVAMPRGATRSKFDIDENMAGASRRINVISGQDANYAINEAFGRSRRALVDSERFANNGIAARNALNRNMGSGGAGKKSEINSLTFNFAQYPYNTSIPVFSNTGPSSLASEGTVFDWAWSINVVENVTSEAFVSAVCTRIAESTAMTRSVGYCHITYTLAEVSFTVNGKVQDIVGGILAVTGGDEVFNTVSGEVSLRPIYAKDATTFDFFTDAEGYIGTADLIAV